MLGKFFVVDDEKAIRNGIAGQLERRNFKVEKAANVAEARHIIGAATEPFDVVLLDVNLMDSDEPEVTGLDLGLEMEEKWSSNPPLFLVFSAFRDIKFYEKALNLGAEAYISKPQNDAMMVARIRALTLKRYFQIKRLDCDESVNVLIGQARDKVELVNGLINRMTEEFKAFLPSNHMFLVSYRGRTLLESNQYPTQTIKNLDVHKLSALIFGHCTEKAYHQLDSYDIQERGSWCDQQDIRFFEGAVFVPLVETPEIHVVLGLLQHNQDARLKDDLCLSADALARFFKYPFYEAISHTLTTWGARWTRRKTSVEMTAQLCLLIGREQLGMLGQKKYEWNTQTKLGFWKLAESLHDSGNFLDSMFEDIDQPSRQQQRRNSTLRKEVEEAWKTIWETYEVPESTLEIQNDVPICTILGSLHLILSRVLQWAVERMKDQTPKDQRTPRLFINCAQEANKVVLVIEDFSSRVSRNARQLLFQPFSQKPLEPLGERKYNIGIHFPLFLARILSESHLGGSFRDCTSELKTNFGHRFVLEFPGIQDGFQKPKAMISTGSTNLSLGFVLGHGMLLT